VARFEFYDTPPQVAGEIVRLRAAMAANRLLLAGLKLALLSAKAGFREDQPRIPAGNHHLSGQWAGGDGGVAQQPSPKNQIERARLPIPSNILKITKPMPQRWRNI